MSQLSADEEHEKLVEQWKIKNLIKRLSQVKGNGTSMISLIIPPKDQVSQVTKMLTDEFHTASNIKSRVNKLSVLAAITSAKERLKLYNKVPPNGLVIYCGTAMTDEGKEKKLAIHFEPFKPINTSSYLCSNKFDTEPLAKLLESDSVFGFIVMDGNGCLFATLTGNTATVLQKFSVELPKKHGRGGQSAVRFARLRVEKRHNYVRKCAEFAVQIFLTNDKPNVQGLVLAGSASFKIDLYQSDMFDQRLKAIVIKTVDTSYGGELGFNQAIELSKQDLANVKFIREKELLTNYMQEISRDTNKYCFGLRDTMRALEMGAINTLIVWENLDLIRIQLRNPTNEETQTIYLPPQEVQKGDYSKDSSGTNLDIVDQSEFLDWLTNNYKQFGVTLEFVTDKSQEGAQFVKGFGGIGGLLRYAVDLAELDDYLDNDKDDDEWI